jgi:hypothetical protein
MPLHPSLTDGTFDRAGKPTQSKPTSSTPRANASFASSSQNDAKRLGAIERKDGTEELRIESKSYNGYPYIDVRVWFTTDGGEWRPTRTGVTIRPRELDEVIAALGRALAIVKGSGA